MEETVTGNPAPVKPNVVPTTLGTLPVPRVVVMLVAAVAR